MAGRRITVARFEEIQRLLVAGRKLREISRSLGVSRKTVRAVRDQELSSLVLARKPPEPLWMSQLEWPTIVSELGRGFPLKFIWEERAQSLTTYTNFWKQFYRKYPYLKEAAVTLREFEPGERAEVDYAGDKIEWVELRTGEVFEAVVFLGVLGFSQKIFANASENMKSCNWLHSHRKMYESFAGVPAATVPDCLKQGVLKCHLYDPDINPSYAELASHYGTAVVPARPRKPKDKALVEGAVKILMRYFRWKYRGQTFTSIADINRALEICVEQINSKPHTRFRISRNERFEKLEKPALKPLPVVPFEVAQWRRAKLHADCYVSVDCNYYSAPHIHRGKELRIKLTERQVEIFLDFERITLHQRYRGHVGKRIKILEHFPESSKAYYEATPQNLLTQAKFIHLGLHALVVELFNEDVYGNIRRVQGLVRIARKEIHETNVDLANPRIAAAIVMMRNFKEFRVKYFEECLKRERRKRAMEDPREISRDLPNPMLRYGEVKPKEIMQ